MVLFNYIDLWSYSKVPTIQFSTDYRTVVFRKYLTIFLKSYKEYKQELFPYEAFHPNQYYGDYGQYHPLEAEINVGVVFVGFPDNSIPRMRVSEIK